MRLTDFLASVGRDFALQQKFWRSQSPRLADDEQFQRLLGHHGWKNLSDEHREILREADLARIQEELTKEADVTAHVGFGPCWVLVRV